MPAEFTYPVMGAGAYPGMRPRLGALRLLVIAASALAALVVLLTVVAVLVRPVAQTCGLHCGPRVGRRLLSPTAYTNQKWGFTVEYDGNAQSIGSQDADSVSLQSSNGDGEVDFSVASGSDVDRANQDALSSLPSSQFQDVQSIGPVRGAEIGFVPGQGNAYSAQFVTSDGSAVPVGVVIFSASSGDITITVVAFSQQSNDVANAPYGLDMGQLFDYPVSNTIWSGQ